MFIYICIYNFNLYVSFRTYQYNLNTHVQKSWRFVFCLFGGHRHWHSLHRMADKASNTTDSLDALLRQMSSLRLHKHTKDKVKHFELKKNCLDYV